mgnify:CR=1 FL=1
MGLTYIKSRNSENFKAIKQIIKFKRKRVTKKLYWIEGEKNLRTFLNFENKQLIFRIITTENLFKSIQEDFQLYSDNFEYLIFSETLFEEISLINTRFKVGFLVTFKPGKKSLEVKDQTDILYFNDIQDPGNLGTIIRSCAAMNVGEIWLSSTSVDPWSPKVVRAAAGYHGLVNLVVFESFATVLEASSNLTLSTYLLSPEKNATSLFEQNLKRKNLFIFGSEGKGFPNFLRENLEPQNILKIPHIGVIDSLNLSVAASLCIVEARRQRGLLLSSR